MRSRSSSTRATRTRSTTPGACASRWETIAGAADAWRRLAVVNPASARTHSRLGALYACLDRGAPFQLDSAERHLRRAHELNKEENGPLLRLAEVALMRGDRASARRDLAPVLKTDVNNAMAHFYTGYLALRDKDLPKAREELRRAATAPSARRFPRRGVGRGRHEGRR